MRRAIAGRILAGLLPLAALAGGAASAQPLDLKSAIGRALEAEAGYRAARAELHAVREEVPKARAALLPSLSVSGTHTFNNANRTLSNGVTDEPDYTARNYSITLRQPIYARESTVRREQADTRIAAAEEQTRVERAKLVLDVSEQYLECLYASAVERYARVEIESLEGLLASVTRGFEAGVNTRTDILDAEARLDAARVRLVEAQQRVDAARRALEKSIGLTVSEIRPIAAHRLSLSGNGMSVETWQDAALATNPEIRAAKENVKLARQEIELQRAGHHPTVDLIVQRQFARSDSISTLGSRVDTTLWGVQFNIPIYSGGYVTAATRQASARLGRARAELEAAEADVSLRAARAVEFLQASGQRVQALARAEASAGASLTGTERGLKAGTRSFVDVLNARQSLFEVVQSRARANADFVLGFLRLQAVAGSIDDAAIEAANALLSNDATVVLSAPAR